MSVKTFVTIQNYIDVISEFYVCVRENNIIDCKEFYNYTVAM